MALLVSFVWKKEKAGIEGWRPASRLAVLDCSSTLSMDQDPFVRQGRALLLPCLMDLEAQTNGSKRKERLQSLKHSFSKCVPWTSSIGTTWEYVRHTHAQASSKT